MYLYDKTIFLDVTHSYPKRLGKKLLLNLKSNEILEIAMVPLMANIVCIKYVLQEFLF